MRGRRNKRVKRERREAMAKMRRERLEKNEAEKINNLSEKVCVRTLEPTRNLHGCSPAPHNARMQPARGAHQSCCLGPVHAAAILNGSAGEAPLLSRRPVNCRPKWRAAAVDGAADTLPAPLRQPWRGAAYRNAQFG